MKKSKKMRDKHRVSVEKNTFAIYGPSRSFSARSPERACEGLSLGWVRVPTAPKLNNPLEGSQDCSCCCPVKRPAGSGIDTLKQKKRLNSAPAMQACGEFGSKKATAILGRLQVSRSRMEWSPMLRAAHPQSSQACLVFSNPAPPETEFTTRLHRWR